MTALLHLDDDGAGTEVVRVVGDVDVASAPSVGEALQQAVGRATRAVVVDLAEVGFLDSSGVRTLLAAREAALATEVAIELRNLQPAVIRVLQVTGVAPVFQL